MPVAVPNPFVAREPAPVAGRRLGRSPFRLFVQVAMTASIAWAVYEYAAGRELADPARADYAAAREAAVMAGRAHQAAVEAAGSGAMTQAEVADRLERDVIPLWAEAARLAEQATRHPWRGDEAARLSARAASVTLRRDAAAALAAAFRTGDEAALRKAEWLWAEADRLDRGSPVR